MRLSSIVEVTFDSGFTFGISLTLDFASIIHVVLIRNVCFESRAVLEHSEPTSIISITKSQGMAHNSSA